MFHNHKKNKSLELTYSFRGNGRRSGKGGWATTEAFGLGWVICCFRLSRIVLLSYCFRWKKHNPCGPWKKRTDLVLFPFVHIIHLSMGRARRECCLFIKPLISSIHMTSCIIFIQESEGEVRRRREYVVLLDKTSTRSILFTSCVFVSFPPFSF